MAPDKFKGALTAVQVAEHLATGLRSALPDVDNPLTGSQGAGPQTSDDRPSVRQV
ncbi:MAG: hypothetical protein HOQ18_08910 [Dermatophilaceae bacterium]|nr:hypothetical protein [Dermatophilaceae bacterium]NUR80515.1 hypothetical protein [Dermatophilaceae bacterium]